MKHRDINVECISEESREEKLDFAFISVIVPVFNDAKGLSDTLESLINQNYPEEHFEIIVVDNGSTDNTSDIINSFLKRYPKLVHSDEENLIQSSYAARNKGVKASKGPIIAFIDADMTVDRDWLIKINSSLRKGDWDYLACEVDIYFKKASIYSVYNKIYGFPIKSYVYNLHFAPTCCLVVKKSIFEDLGLFDPRLISSGDLEFGNRVYASKRKMMHDSDILMLHPARSSFMELYKKFFRIGRGLQQISYLYPERYSGFGAVLKPFPKNPSKFFKSMNGNELWDELPLNNKIRIYFIEWMERVVKRAGYTYEKVRQK